MSMAIGIKLADGSFYPILEEGLPEKKILELTTVNDNQTTVQVDLYRSGSGTMENAEYIDTMRIDNLIPHPNGEPSINLSIGLDEAGSLSAEVLDPETGVHTHTTVNLITRPQSERDEVPDFTLTETFDAPQDDELRADFDTESTADSGMTADTAPESPVADTGEGIPGDFAADGAEQKYAEAAVPDEPEDIAVNDFEVPDIEPVDTAGVFLEDPFAVSEADAAPENTAADTNTAADVQSFDEPPLPAAGSVIDMTAPAETAQTADGFDLPDFDADGAADGSAPELSLPDSGTDAAQIADGFDLPDFDADAAADGSALEPALTDSGTDAAQIADGFDLPDFDAGAAADGSAPELSLTDSGTDAAQIADGFDLPDFDAGAAADGSAPEPALTDSGTAAAQPAEDFDLPDFDSAETGTPTAQDKPDTADNLPDFSDMNFDVPDFDESAEKPLNLSNLLDDEAFSVDDQSAAGSLDDSDFLSADAETDTSSHMQQQEYADTGIPETPLFDESLFDDTETASKGKSQIGAVVICIICAVICLAALAGIFMLVPSRFNGRTAPDTAAQEQHAAGSSQQTAAEQAVMPKENQIVVAPVPDIVPLPPEPAPAEQNVTYQIKWGDTLWDIAAAYYRNPWRYPEIAEANNISNPDYIVSGTTIVIPPR